MFSLKSWSTTLAFWAALACTASAQVSVLAHYTNAWSLHKGTSAPQSDWKMVGAVLDGTWQTNRPGGFGYASNANETNQVRTVLFDMAGARPTNYTTFFIRQDFTVSSVETNRHLSLVVDYDDGYIAFLDGTYLASANSPGAPNDPALNARATTDHESSRGNSSPQPAVTNALGAVGSRLVPGTHTLAVIGINDNTNSSDCILLASLYLVDAPTNPPGGTNGCVVSGALAANATWYRTNNPYLVVGNITVNSGVTLTIEPGVNVLFNQGLGMTINGRLLAEGTPEDRITFTRNAGATTWSQLNFTGNSTTSHIAYADIRFFASSAIEANGTSLHLNDIAWTNSTAQVVDLNSSSIVLLNSYIPGGAGNEPVHFNSMPANGHALIKGCVFGAPQGYNDSIDFTGGNRPGPIVQFIDNIFLAAVDDCFDMDGTDAHIEGNIFLNVHQDASRASSANPISTGADGGNRSELVVVRNLFWNCDHTLLIKDLGSVVFQNNTVVTVATNNFSSMQAAFINFSEPHRDTPGGRGIVMDGNILWDLHSRTPFLNFTNGTMFLNVSHSIIENTNVPGPGNSTNDPMFVNWHAVMTPANIRSNLSLLPGSPARGTGPNGLDMGALVPAGASISGEPTGTTTNTSAVLTVAGPGIYAYRWKLNDGPWSNEVPLTNNFLITSNFFANALPITLSNLANGTYTVFAVGKNSAGAWQDTNNPTASRTWTVAAGLKIDRIYSIAPGSATIEFLAEGNKGYTIWYRESLTEGAWVPGVHLDPIPSPHPVSFTDTFPPETPTRFYRISE